MVCLPASCEIEEASGVRKEIGRAPVGCARSTSPQHPPLTRRSLPMTPASSTSLVLVPGASSRRRFLQRSLLASGASVLGFPAVVSSKSPNSKMNIAFIAAGGRGGAHVAEAKKMPELVDVIALCDVNSKNLEYAA